MTIYGVALLAFCFLVGKLIGNGLGLVIGFDGDVGGVGFAMILLIVSNAFMKKKGWLADATEKGILFWSSMYIPIVVAMSATQNVKAAIIGRTGSNCGRSRSYVDRLLIGSIDLKNRKKGRSTKPKRLEDGYF